jgi:hypothetical protein
MAARLNRLHQDAVKEKIKVSQLINAVQNHALGTHELSSTQLDAAKFLLNKRIGNAAQIVEQTISGELAITRITREIVRAENQDT